MSCGYLIKVVVPKSCLDSVFLYGEIDFLPHRIGKKVGLNSRQQILIEGTKLRRQSVLRLWLLVSYGCCFLTII